MISRLNDGVYKHRVFARYRPAPGLPSHARCATHAAVVRSFTVAAPKLTCEFSGVIMLFAGQNRDEYFSVYHVVNLH